MLIIIFTSILSVNTYLTSVSLRDSRRHQAELSLSTVKQVINASNPNECLSITGWLFLVDISWLK
jgi:hypothetical protein